jgi:hypothetical protein
MSGTQIQAHSPSVLVRKPGCHRSVVVAGAAAAAGVVAPAPLLVPPAGAYANAVTAGTAKAGLSIPKVWSHRHPSWPLHLLLSTLQGYLVIGSAYSSP